MQTSNKTNTAKQINEVKKPALLRQIVDKVDGMEEGEKKLLLLTLMQDELSAKYRKLDNEIASSKEIMNEKKINALVTATRNEMYEQKIRS
jgi:hypothetical protein